MIEPQPVPVAIRRLPHAEGLPLPQYMSAAAAGCDLPAAVEEPVVLQPGERQRIPTGFAIALPPGYEAEVRPRSGLAWQYGVTCLNSPGTVDADYRGEIFVLLINLGDQPFVIRRGDRIAQLVVRPVCRIQWIESDHLPSSSRGEGGFGHTGR